MATALPLALYLAALFTTSYAFLDRLHPVKFLPNDPKVEEGGTLHMTCEIKDRYRRQYHSELLRFGRHENNNIIDFNLNQSVIISDYRADLIVPGVPMTWNDCYIYCYINDTDRKTWDHQKLFVGRKPLTPQPPVCVVHNWETMTCTWTPSSEQQFQYTKFHFNCAETHGSPKECMNISLWWTTNRGERTWLECREADHCDWEGKSDRTLHMDRLYRMKVKVVNLLGHAESTAVTVDPTQIVKPDAISGFRVVPYNTTMVELQYVFPKPDKELEMRMSYRSQWDKPGVWQNVTLVEETTYKMHVIPYTSYTVQIQIKPRLHGFWSEIFTKTFRSNPTVPGRNPQLNPSAFIINDDPCNPVTIFWKSIPVQEQHGVNFTYKVTFNSGEKKISVFDPSGSTHVTLHVSCKRTRPLHVTVISKNSVGETPDTSQSIVIPTVSSVLPAPDNVRFLASDDRHVTASWPAADGSTVSQTVFWCPSDKHAVDCLGDIQWKKVAADVSHYDIVLPVGDKNSYQEYVFGLSVESADSSSGITWTDCVYDKRENALEPSNVKLTPSQEHRSLSLEWEHPRCSPGVRGLVSVYVIFYCPAAEASNQCTGAEKNVSVSSKLSRFTLQGLEPHQYYKAWIVSVTDSGMSKPGTQAVKHRTSASWVTAGVITAFVILGILLSILLIVGIIFVIRRFTKFHKWYMSDVPIRMPQNVYRRSKESTSSEYPLTGYMTNNPRVSYRKQTSVRSVTSADSGIDDNGHSPFLTGYSAVGLSENNNTTPTTLLELTIPEDTTDEVFEDADGSGNYFVKTYQLPAAARARPEYVNVMGPDGKRESDLGLAYSRLETKPNGRYARPPKPNRDCPNYCRIQPEKHHQHMSEALDNALYFLKRSSESESSTSDNKSGDGSQELPNFGEKDFATAEKGTDVLRDTIEPVNASYVSQETVESLSKLPPSNQNEAARSYVTQDQAWFGTSQPENAEHISSYVTVDEMEDVDEAAEDSTGGFIPEHDPEHLPDVTSTKQQGLFQEIDLNRPMPQPAAQGGYIQESDLDRLMSKPSVRQQPPGGYIQESDMKDLLPANQGGYVQQSDLSNLLPQAVTTGKTPSGYVQESDLDRLMPKPAVSESNGYVEEGDLERLMPPTSSTTAPSPGGYIQESQLNSLLPQTAQIAANSGGYVEESDLNRLLPESTASPLVDNRGVDPYISVEEAALFPDARDVSNLELLEGWTSGGSDSQTQAQTGAQKPPLISNGQISGDADRGLNDGAGAGTQGGGSNCHPAPGAGYMSWGEAIAQG